MALSPLKFSWQEALSDLITDPEELLDLLELDSQLLASAKNAARLFPLKVTRSFVKRIQKNNLNDPLLKQILPLDIELKAEANSIYVPDPLGEAEANPIRGLLHKYKGRVLVTLTSACAIHCRYCFRRYFPYEENNPGRRGWEKIFAYIGEEKSISEVILSGGDPLSVSDGLLKSFSDQLSLIPHVKTLRIHTRLPVVLPERITNEFLAWTKQLKQKLVIVIHANHPNEISDEVHSALQQLRSANVIVMNQSVLLKGVNDCPQVLAELSETLFAAGVLPYYLHVLDKVKGTAHFDLPLTRAKEIHEELTKLLPGYLVPKLAREDAGMPSKTFL